MEVEKVREIMKKMASMVSSQQSMFSVEYLKKMLDLKKNDLRMNKINKMFDE
jgi:hypothetical protein